MRHRRTPRTTPAVPPSFRSWPAIALLIVSTCAGVAWGGSPTETRRERFERILASLTTGPRSDRLERASDVRELFRSVPVDKDEEDAPTPEEISDAILEAIATQPDEFVSWSILDHLVSGDDPGLLFVFHEALVSGSPNLRSIALRWHARNEDIDAIPILEELWDGGVPEWARVDLMRALTHQKSSTHLDDFLGLTSDADLAVRIAAIEALGELHDDAALPRLLELARTGDRHERGSALAAISEWTESDAAFAMILDASRPDERLQSTALSLLKSFHRPERDERLLQALAERGDPWLRLTAARALEESSHPGVTASLVALLGEPGIRDEAWMVHDIRQVLFNRDDPEALPGLQALVEAGAIDDLEDMEKLMTYLGRQDRSRRLISVTSSCGGWGGPRPDDPDTWHVVAPHGWRSIRCAPGPAMTTESWLEPRIQDGSLVTIEDRFDRRGETWALVQGLHVDDCWVQASDLERGGGPGERALDPLALELDLPAAAIGTKSARRLVRNGILEPFDADDGVIGVVLRPRSDGPSLEDLAAWIVDGPGEDAEDVLDDLIERIETALEEEAEASDDAEEED